MFRNKAMALFIIAILFSAHRCSALVSRQSIIPMLKQENEALPPKTLTEIKLTLDDLSEQALIELFDYLKSRETAEETENNQEYREESLRSALIDAHQKQVAESRPFRVGSQGLIATISKECEKFALVFDLEQ